MNKISGGLLRQSVHYVQPILACPPHAISKVLDRLKIRPDKHQFKQAGGQLGAVKGDEDEGEAGAVLPPSGSFVPIEDHHLLRDDLELEFEVGEYVAYELDDQLCGLLFILLLVFKC